MKSMIQTVCQLRYERALKLIIRLNIGGHGFGGSKAQLAAKYALNLITRFNALYDTWSLTEEDLDYIDGINIDKFEK